MNRPSAAAFAAATTFLTVVFSFVSPASAQTTQQNLPDRNAVIAIMRKAVP